LAPFGAQLSAGPAVAGFLSHKIFTSLKKVAGKSREMFFAGGAERHGIIENSRIIRSAHAPRAYSRLAVRQCRAGLRS